MASASEQLCISCGFCCDGTIFNVVVLKAEELEPARRLKLRVVSSDDGRIGIKQPCSAIRSDGCQVYSERPSLCRAFRCELLKSLEAGRVPLDSALTIVQQVKERAARIEAAVPPLPADEADPPPLRIRAWRENQAGRLTQETMLEIMMNEGMLAQHFCASE